MPGKMLVDNSALYTTHYTTGNIASHAKFCVKNISLNPPITKRLYYLWSIYDMG